MKTCSKCKTEKDLSDFYHQSDRKSRTTYCKECFNKYCVERWITKKKQAIEYKGGSCINCGYDQYYGALHFHHIDPKEKDHNWTKLRSTSWDKIVKELDKCVLLCANCHAEEHALVYATGPGC